ncbi:MAG: MBL fold metallo-hydrolase [Acidobacteria bacterium]|nr:MBL fold metallo-hydrolase [Acidobacteriota bacterium]
MRKSLSLVLLGAALLALDVRAQDAKGVLDAAAQAMGTAGLHSVQYSGTGSVFMLGQNFRPDAPWPRFKVVKYANAVNYDTPALREELVRVDDENPARGGGAGGFNPATGQGGMRPILGEQTQVRQATTRTDLGTLQIWMTPHGFLKAAAANNATASAGRPRTISFKARGKYTVTATLNDQNLVERVETRVDNAMLGDMLIEDVYSGYTAFGGVQFPTHIVERQGGNPTLDLTVSSVQPNGAPTVEIRENAGGGEGGGGGAARAESKSIGEGAWDVTAAGLHSVLVEFSDHLVVVEASSNDARSQAVMAEAKRLVPNKPIRYLVNTHAHYDHSGGVRAFAAEGATILTYELNKPFFERIFKLPHTINPDNLSRSSRTPVVEGVGEKYVLTDGRQTVELHHIRGNLHNEGLLMVYLPRQKVVIQSDAFHPRPGAKPYPTPPQFTTNFYENIQRLKLDVAQVLHIHGGMDPIAVVARAAGKS